MISGPIDFEVLLGARRRAGRAELANAMRILSEQNDPESYQAVAEVVSGDAMFEPRLFSQMALGGFSGLRFAQLVFAGIPDGMGWLDVASDPEGTVHLPGFGRVETPWPSASLVARVTGTVLEVGPDPAGASLFEVRDSVTVPGTGVVVVDVIDPVLGAFLAEHVDADQSELLLDDQSALTAMLARAIELVGVVNPGYRDALLGSLRGVVAYRHNSADSFAALGMHGLVFLNVPARPSIGYFVEELVHQGSHVLFSEATLARADFFRPEPDTTLGMILGTPDDRTIYDAFHGLFTEHMEYQTVAAVLAQVAVTGDERADFEQHLAAVSERHRHDLRVIEPQAGQIFSNLGRTVFDAMAESFRDFEESQSRDPDHAAAARSGLTTAGRSAS